MSHYYSSSSGSYCFYSNKDSPSVFIFIAKDGLAYEEELRHPVRWILLRGSGGHAVIRRGTKLGPDFGTGGFRVDFNDGWGPFKLMKSPTKIPGTKASQFLQRLHGETVLEIEVYRDCNEPAALVDYDTPIEAQGAAQDVIDAEQADDARMFNSLIAGSFMEERMGLWMSKLSFMLWSKGSKQQLAP